ncbi:MAG: hypothetical protein GX442_24245 [Candidatus Riflebacteria bacterium]|nr:hypothetical protein [Candidatus Riflebacteria bacterium]
MTWVNRTKEPPPTPAPEPVRITPAARPDWVGKFENWIGGTTMPTPAHVCVVNAEKFERAKVRFTDAILNEPLVRVFLWHGVGVKIRCHGCGISLSRGASLKVAGGTGSWCSKCADPETLVVAFANGSRAEGVLSEIDAGLAHALHGRRDALVKLIDMEQVRPEIEALRQHAAETTKKMHADHLAAVRAEEKLRAEQETAAMEGKVAL